MLFSALDFAHKAIRSNPVVPILENYLMHVSTGRLYVQATDLDNFITASIDVEVFKSEAKDFDFLFPSNAYDYLKVLEEQPITITTEESSQKWGTHAVSIITDEGKAQFQTDNPKDFVKAPSRGNDVSFFKLPHEVLPEFKDMLGYASQDELRPALTGINLMCENNKLVLGATDGHTLKKKPICEVDPALSKLFILPRRAARILSEIQSSSIGIYVEFDGIKHAFFSGLHCNMEFEIISKVIDEKYPDINGVIPKADQVKSKFTFDRITLLGLMNRSKPFRSTYTKQVMLTMTKDKCELFTENHDFGIEIKLDARGTLTGDEIKIGFNSDFMIRALGSLSADEVTIEMQAPTKPIVIRDGDTTVLLMPVMVNQYV